jgi:hypothetical protein
MRSALSRRRHLYYNAHLRREMAQAVVHRVDGERVMHQFAQLKRESWTMHQRSVHQVGFAALAALLLTSLISCATAPARPVVALPNGYYLQPDAQDQSQIVKRGGREVLPTSVAAYAVSGYLVAGALGDAPASSRLYTNDLPFTGGPDTRYFILNTSSGKLESDLAGPAWHARLKELGVPSDFQIYPPLPWQQ